MLSDWLIPIEWTWKIFCLAGNFFVLFHESIESILKRHKKKERFINSSFFCCCAALFNTSERLRWTMITFKSLRQKLLISRMCQRKIFKLFMMSKSASRFTFTCLKFGHLRSFFRWFSRMIWETIMKVKT